MELNLELSTGRLAPLNFEQVRIGQGARVARLQFKRNGADEALPAGSVVRLEAARPETPSTPALTLDDWGAPQGTRTWFEKVYNDLTIPRGTLKARIFWQLPGETAEHASEIFHLMVRPGAAGAGAAPRMCGASQISFAPSGGLSSTSVAAALRELDAEKIGEAELALLLKDKADVSSLPNFGGAGMVYVAANGDDATGAVLSAADVGKPARAFKTAQAAYDAVKSLATAAKKHVLKLGVGGFSITLDADWNPHVMVSGAGADVSALTISGYGATGVTGTIGADAQAAPPSEWGNYGYEGGDGGSGGSGGNGKNINLTSDLSVMVNIHSRGGAGGYGGSGGRGGKGSDTLDSTNNNASGYSQSGGEGGAGGRGGTGGIGGAGGNITLTKVWLGSVGTTGGQGGQGGMGGQGGDGGDGDMVDDWGGYGGYGGRGGKGGQGGKGGIVSLTLCRGGEVRVSGGSGGYGGYYGSGGYGGSAYNFGSNGWGYNYGTEGGGGAPQTMAAQMCEKINIYVHGGDVPYAGNGGTDWYGNGVSGGAGGKCALDYCRDVAVNTRGGRVEYYYLEYCTGGAGAELKITGGENIRAFAETSSSGYGMKCGATGKIECVDSVSALEIHADTGYDEYHADIGDVVVRGGSARVTYSGWNDGRYSPVVSHGWLKVENAAICLVLNVTDYNDENIFDLQFNNSAVDFGPFNSGNNHTLNMRLAGCRISPAALEAWQTVKNISITEYDRAGAALPASSTYSDFPKASSANMLMPAL